MTTDSTGAGTRVARYRADIDGMRALAVGLVVAFHAGVGLVPGGFVGVDVFFVLSGYLITGLLAEEITRTGRVSFTGFYGRRARRLLPMATVVLVATAVAFGALLSPLDRGPLGADVRAAALYVANWHFAGASLDYMSDPSKSAVLHYWSLSVEEQFYVVWPVLLVLVTGGLWRRRACDRAGQRALHRRMVVALAVLAAVSLSLSIVLTPRSLPYAYYGLHTRAWELAAGGLLALLSAHLDRWPIVLRSAMGWCGCGFVLASALLFGPTTVFPGSAALLPVVGTLLLVAAAVPGRPPVGVSRLLSTAPFSYVGRISYSWYLWHWPCIMYAAVVTGQVDDVSGAHPHGWPAFMAVTVAFVLSAATYAVIESPVRRSAWLAASRPRSLALGGSLTLASVTAVALALPSLSAAAPAGPVRAVVAPGIGHKHAATDSSPAREIKLRMSAVQARHDMPDYIGGCYNGYGGSGAPPDCRFGDPDGATTVALIGDSHAEQWFPGLRTAAERAHWQLFVWTKSGCPLIDLPIVQEQFAGRYPSCTDWRANVMDRLRAGPMFDAVVVSNFGHMVDKLGSGNDGHRVPRSDAGDAWHAAWQQTLSDLAEVTRRVIVLRDTPKPERDIPACIAAHERDLTACSFPRANAFTDADVLYRAQKSVSSPAVHFVDLDDVLCPATRCPVVWSDGIVMYRDSHHLTATLTERLAPLLKKRLSAALR